MKRIAAVTAVLFLAASPTAMRAQTASGGPVVSSKQALSLQGARAVAGRAELEAKRLGAPGGAIAVVDDGGHVLYLERWDNTFPAAANIAISKARTAALFRRPTKGMEDAIVGGRTTLLAVAEAPLQGGVPIVVDGVVVGAVGVSGAASAQQDEEIASVAARALEGSTSTAR